MNNERITNQTVLDTLTQLEETCGKKALEKLLSEHGIKSMLAVPEQDYAKIIRSAKSSLNACSK